MNAMFKRLPVRPRSAVAALALFALLLTPRVGSAQASVPSAVRDQAATGRRVSLIVTRRAARDASADARRGNVRRQLTAQIAAIDVAAADVDEVAAEAG